MSDTEAGLRSKEKFCARCGANISDSYEPRDEHNNTGSWWCEECQMPVEDEID